MLATLSRGSLDCTPRFAQQLLARHLLASCRSRACDVSRPSVPRSTPLHLGIAMSQLSYRVMACQSRYQMLSQHPWAAAEGLQVDRVYRDSSALLYRSLISSAPRGVASMATPPLSLEWLSSGEMHTATTPHGGPEVVSSAETGTAGHSPLHLRSRLLHRLRDRVPQPHRVEAFLVVRFDDHVDRARLVR